MSRRSRLLHPAGTGSPCYIAAARRRVTPSFDDVVRGDPLGERLQLLDGRVMARPEHDQG
ncbi:hypothetical protein [Azospirillum argentinense]